MKAVIEFEKENPERTKKLNSRRQTARRSVSFDKVIKLKS